MALLPPLELGRARGLFPGDLVDAKGRLSPPCLALFCLGDFWPRGRWLLGRSGGVLGAPPPSGKNERPRRSSSSSPDFPAAPGSPFAAQQLSETLPFGAARPGSERLKPGPVVGRAKRARRSCLGEPRGVRGERSLLDCRARSPKRCSPLAAGLLLERRKRPRMPAEELNATALKDARLKDLLFHRGIFLALLPLGLVVFFGRLPLIVRLSRC